ncbi:MAG: tyrosine-type recombinase/integrase [Bryobacteraceae bacterium]
MCRRPAIRPRGSTGSCCCCDLSIYADWHVVKEVAAKAGIDKLAPHDLRRTTPGLCHQAGGELDQIQFLLGHVSVQTTERYLGCIQRIRCAVNDRLESSQSRQGMPLLN